MSSESERKLSLEELRQMNMPQQPPPEQHPTAADWLELSAALGAVGQLLAEQNLTLEDLSRRSYPGPTPKQITELLQEMKAIHRLLEQAGKKKERRFSLPRFQMPQPTWTWLAVPAILLGLWALWYSLAALWSGLAGLLR